MGSKGIVLTEYVRTPNPVTGVQLTEDNIDAVAVWCGGAIFEGDREIRKIEDGTSAKYLKVPHVHNHLYAYIGDYLFKDSQDGRFSRIAKSVFEKEYERKPSIVSFKFDGGTNFVHESGLPGLPGSFPGANPEMRRRRAAQVLRSVKSPRNVQ